MQKQPQQQQQQQQFQRASLVIAGGCDCYDE
jgi:hypothetical protein